MKAAIKDAKPAKRRRSFLTGGRLTLILLGFLLLATGVIARRTFGIRQAREIGEIRQQRDAAEAARVTLENEIRDASSRERIVPIAEQRLQMHVPADSQIIYLSRVKANR